MRFGVRAPVVLMVLAATAIPVELRSLGSFGSSIQLPDVLLNIAGFVPVGYVLTGLGPLRALLAATAMTVTAESSQLLMMHRDPSVVDIITNIIGAAIGIALAWRWPIVPLTLIVNRWTALAAATAAMVLIAVVWATSGAALSARGATTEGTLEAHWKLDESEGNVALDASGHDWRGTLHNRPARVPGMRGGGLAFDGASAYVDVDRPASLRLEGDLTVSAWIRAAANPVDDAAIVSAVHHVGSNPDDPGYGVGFQLDTTVDTGPRTVGFKIMNRCGRLVARYGKTPLRLDTWYHVAGVYEATRPALHVYLDGMIDDGTLHGTVQNRRRASREPLFLGRRSDRSGYGFTGVIDDVRIYSRALTQGDVEADMRGVRADAPTTPLAVLDDVRVGAAGTRDPECSWSSEQEDARIPGAVAALGVLVAVACIGCWPTGGAVIGCVASMIAGVLLFHIATPTLPAMNQVLFPLTSLAGAASVIASRQGSPAA